MSEKLIKSKEEFEEHYLPNSVLDSLKNVICTELCIGPLSKAKVHKNKDNLRTGLIKIVRPSSDFLGISGVENIVKHFYSKRGFNVKQKNEKGGIYLRKKSEEYLVFIHQLSGSYNVHVTEGIKSFPSSLSH